MTITELCAHGEPNAGADCMDCTLESYEHATTRPPMPASRRTVAAGFVRLTQYRPGSRHDGLEVWVQPSLVRRLAPYSQFWRSEPREADHTVIYFTAGDGGLDAIDVQESVDQVLERFGEAQR